MNTPNQLIEAAKAEAVFVKDDAGRLVGSGYWAVEVDGVRLRDGSPAPRFGDRDSADKAARLVQIAIEASTQDDWHPDVALAAYKLVRFGTVPGAGQWDLMCDRLRVEAGLTHDEAKAMMDEHMKANPHTAQPDEQAPKLEVDLERKGRCPGCNALIFKCGCQPVPPSEGETVTLEVKYHTDLPRPEVQALAIANAVKETIERLGSISPEDVHVSVVQPSEGDAARKLPDQSAVSTEISGSEGEMAAEDNGEPFYVHFYKDNPTHKYVVYDRSGECWGAFIGQENAERHRKRLAANTPPDGHGSVVLSRDDITDLMEQHRNAESPHDRRVFEACRTALGVE